MKIKLQLSDEIAKRLDDLVHQTGKSRLFYILFAISNNLEDQEDIHNTEQVILSVRNRTEKIYTAEEVKKILEEEVWQKA